ncbi:MAG: hypothetical protein H9W81_10185 [Enterococcus sp.]|nr:hypothetical protein [Enterococcus sp.]
MCNAKPGQRCESDSYNVLQSKMRKFSAYTEKLGTDNMTQHQLQETGKLAKSINDQKIFYYATAGAQKDPQEAMAKVSRLNKQILEKNQYFLDLNESDMFRTAQYLGKLQEFADHYRRVNKTSQIETARLMRNVDGFDYVVRTCEQRFSSEEESEINKYFGSERPELWEEMDVVHDIRDKFSRKRTYLHRAFEIADTEAGDVIQLDQRKNSKNYQVGTAEAPVKISYWKTYSGVFEATSKFRVDANTQEEAEEKARSMFVWPAEINVVKSRNSEKYLVDIKYLWRGSERVEDMHNHHLRFWKPGNYLV